MLHLYSALCMEMCKIILYKCNYTISKLTELRVSKILSFGQTDRTTSRSLPCSCWKMCVGSFKTQMGGQETGHTF